MVTIACKKWRKYPKIIELCEHIRAHSMSVSAWKEHLFIYVLKYVKALLTNNALFALFISLKFIMLGTRVCLIYTLMYWLHLTGKEMNLENESLSMFLKMCKNGQKCLKISWKSTNRAQNFLKILIHACVVMWSLLITNQVIVRNSKSNELVNLPALDLVSHRIAGNESTNQKPTNTHKNCNWKGIRKVQYINANLTGASKLVLWELFQLKDINCNYLTGLLSEMSVTDVTVLKLFIYQLIILVTWHSETSNTYKKNK